MNSPPLLLLGVRRSGTTLLRVMLDRHPDLAVPDESYFVPQLARRHRGVVDPEEFVEDLRRLPTIREWEIDPEAVRRRLRGGMTTGEAIAAVYEQYAADRGKDRWGDKTPMYMRYLSLLERLFPEALYVHLIRDGRDAALSFLSMPPGIVTESWAHPRTAGDFACQWCTEVAAALRLGRRVGPDRYLEVRYEQLVADPEAGLRRICAFAGLSFAGAMLGYASEIDVSAKPHHQSLKLPPTPGLRDWRTAMSREDIATFEEVAADLLVALGYEASRRTATLRGRMRLARYAVPTAAWRAASAVMQRSPLWRRRHPRLY